MAYNVVASICERTYTLVLNDGLLYWKRETRIWVMFLCTNIRGVGIEAFHGGLDYIFLFNNRSPSTTLMHLNMNGDAIIPYPPKT